MFDRIVERLRWRVSSVRARSALAAAAVVVAVAGLAGIGLIYAASTFLTGNVESSATRRAQELAAVVAGADSGQLAGLLAAGRTDQSLAQVLDGGGQVLGASTALSGRPAITGLRPPPGTTQLEQVRLDPGDPAPTMIVAVGVQASTGVRTVVVAQSLRTAEESTEFFMRSAIVCVPSLAGVVGLATFYFVGRSLRPVEAIRRRVASITARDLRARVPTPATRDEVAALAETMNAMLDRLEGAAERQRWFVADASHELRSPLATLRVGLDLLAANPDVPDQQVRRLVGETERLSRLVADLLLLARADEHGLAAGMSDVDLDDVAYRAQERLRTNAPALAIELRLEPVRVFGDAHQLERAIVNLCDNAARHARSLVAIRVSAKGGHALVSVSDDGAGIDPADRDRIFDRFVRLDDSRTRASGGSGLGLAITREIVHRHGGSVRVEEAPSGGARFTLCLPLPTGSADGSAS